MMWSSLQIVSQFPSLLAHILPAHLVALCDELWFASFSPFGNLGLACISPSLASFPARLVLTTTFPVLIALVLVASYARHRLGKSKDEQARIRDQHARLGLMLCYLVLPSTTTMIFQSFLCDHRFGTGTAYLVADFDVECGSQPHHVLMLYSAVCVLVYPVGINVVFAWLLAQHKDQIQSRQGATHLSFL